MCEAWAGLDLPAQAPECCSFFSRTLLLLPLCHADRTVKWKNFFSCKIITENAFILPKASGPAGSPLVGPAVRMRIPRPEGIIFPQLPFSSLPTPRPPLAYLPSFSLVASSFLVLIVSVLLTEHGLLLLAIQTRFDLSLGCCT